MKNLFFNLQLFAEGGGSGAGSGAEGGDAAAGVEATASGRGNPLSDVVYGKQTGTDGQTSGPTEETSSSSKTKSQLFDELIKGDYREEFQKKADSIVNRRFKETKTMQETLQKHDPVFRMLGEKYGVDANDPAAILKALEEDNSFYEQEALEKGLTVDQLKEVKKLERENEAFRNAKAEAEKRENSQRIYSEWLQQADQLKEKYGLTNFNLQDEIQNPDFLNMLQSGISMESTYKAIHMDEMLEGGMRAASNRTAQQIANNVASRHARPAENGTSASSRIFKTDVNSLTRKDRDEIERRVMRGADISF